MIQHNVEFFPFFCSRYIILTTGLILLERLNSHKRLRAHTRACVHTQPALIQAQSLEEGNHRGYASFLPNTIPQMRKAVLRHLLNSPPSIPFNWLLWGGVAYILLFFFFYPRSTIGPSSQILWANMEIFRNTMIECKCVSSMWERITNKRFIWSLRSL